jgi:AraC-like DNA-binding protein
MKEELNKPSLDQSLFYSCYSQLSRVEEQFVHDHTFTYIMEGNLEFYLAGSYRIYQPGDMLLVKRNQLAKVTKIPRTDGVFKSMSLRLHQDILRAFSMEHDLYTDKTYQGDSIIQLKHDAFYKGFIDSLAPYMTVRPGEVDRSLIQLKEREAVIHLLRLNPYLKDLLFDFGEPGKIDLEEFMIQHYSFNVDMKQFAYLTGRSLATFKRDFEKIFQTSPGRWLQQRRLEQAYYLIKEKGKRPSDVYLEVGFEDLSHFSFAFKKEFGKAPSLLNQESQQSPVPPAYDASPL